MVPGPPDPGRAGAGGPDRLQVLPRHGEHGGHPLTGAAAAALARLTGPASSPAPAGLRAWAARIADPGGRLPLLGTGLRAQPWEALLWNGARLHAAGARESDGLLLVALAAAAPGSDGAAVERGVRTGLAVSAWLDEVTGTGPSAGEPTTAVVSAAACAAVTGGTDPADLAPVLDVAASLMLVRPATGAGATATGLAWGHCLAAGWLAPQLLSAGLVGMAGAVRDTVAAVTGRPPGRPPPVPAPAGDSGPLRPPDELLAALA